MSVVLAVVPLDPRLTIYGDNDPASAYSLSGHVSIALTSPHSLFEARRPARLLLESILITFEGQSEIFTPSTGYSSLRLCELTHELVTGEPIELSNEGHEESNEPCVWNVVFNLPVPGWLPETTTMGIEEIGTRYALYATARFINVEEDQPSSWGFAALCAPFRSRYKIVEAKKDIHICRYIAAPELVAAPPPYLNYLVHSTDSSSKSDVGKDRIPPDVLSKIQVLASVPEHVNIEDCEIPITLRMRTKNLAAEECKKLQVTHISVDLLQQEKCRYRPSAPYLSRYPLPPKQRQPPNHPLREPHPVSSIYDVGLFVSPQVSESICRTFSLMPANERGKYKLPDDNYPFANDAESGSSGTWYTIDSTIPFVQRSPARPDRECVEWAGMPDLRPSSSSPLFTVIHEVTVALTCTYDLEDGGVATERLSFRIPLSFARVAPKLDPVGLRALVFQGVIARTSSPLNGVVTSQVPTHALSKEPASFTLPAYSQLYDSNGDRKVDYSIPLPVYTPRSTPPSGASTLDASSTSTSPSVADSAPPLPSVAIDSSTNFYDNHDNENAPIQHKHAVRPTRLLVFGGESGEDVGAEDTDAPPSPVES